MLKDLNSILGKGVKNITELQTALETAVDVIAEQRATIIRIVENPIVIKGDKGDSPTNDELVNLITPLIPPPVKGDKGDTPSDDELRALIAPLIPPPVKGDDGHTPTVEEILAVIKPLIPPPINGVTPTKEEIIELIRPLIPPAIYIKGDKGDDGKTIIVEGKPDTPNEVLSKVISSDGLIPLYKIENIESLQGKSGGISKGGGTIPLILNGHKIRALKFIGATVTYNGYEATATFTGGSGGSQTPWLSNIDGAGYELTNVGNLEVDGELGSILPPSSPSVAYSYAPIFRPFIVSATKSTGSVFSYDAFDYPVTSPPITVAVYAYTNINDFTTYSSRETTFTFATPATSPGVREITQIGCVPDVAGSLNNTYFLIYNAGTSYYVWFNVDGGGTDPVGGDVGLEVDIASNSNATTIAIAVAGALTGSGFFDDTNQSMTAVNAVCNAYAAETDASDFGTGFSLNVTTQGEDPNTIVTFSLDIAWNAVAGASAYRVVLVEDGIMIGFTSIYETGGTSINLSDYGSEDLGVTQYPDIRPLTDGVGRTYKLYHQLTRHNEVVYSATYASILVQDNNSGYQINSETISWTNTVTSASVIIQRPSDSYSYSTNSVATSSNIIIGNFSNIDLSNNQIYVNDLIINSSNIEVDGSASTIKFWGDFQTEKFHGVGGTSSGAQSFAWLGISSGDYSFTSGIAAVNAADYGVVLGIQATTDAAATYGISIGDNAHCYVVGGIVIGGSNTATAGYRGVIIGSNNSFNVGGGEQGGFIFGTGNSGTGVSHVTLGIANANNGNNSGIFGTLITQNGDGSFSIGYNYTNNNDNAITFGVGSVDMIVIGGKVGIGTQAPTATLHLKAGTSATTNSAPIKFISGSLMTTAEAGAVEYTTTDLYMTPDSAIRYNIPLVNGAGAQGDIIYASAASIYTRLPKDTNATRYLSNTGGSNNPAWAQIDLSNGVTSTLPRANGGSGQTSAPIKAVHFADVNNSGTTETDLYSDTLAAGQFATNGDIVEAQYGGTLVGDATSTQRLKVYFGGTQIFDTGALGIGASTTYWNCYVTIIRESSSIVRCSVALSTSFATLNSYATYTKVTGLTLTNTQILKITGTAAGATAASNQITASEGYVEYKPIN